MTVIKRTKKSSAVDLVEAINELVYHLGGQGEAAAVADLEIAASDIGRFQPGSAEFEAAVDLVIEAFEGEHELSAYTHRRESKGWSEAEQLYLSSTRVLTLVRRFRPVSAAN